MCVIPIREMEGAKKIVVDDFAGDDLTTDVSSTSSSSSDDESEPEDPSDDLSPQIFTIERYDIANGKYLTTICRFSLVLIGDNPLTDDKAFESVEWIILRFGGLIENRFKLHDGAIEVMPDVNNKLRISPPPSGVDIPILVTPYDSTPGQKEVINQFQRGINRDLFSSTFLFDSQRLNSIPDLSKYRIGDSIYADYNPNEILLGDIKWSSLPLKVNPSPIPVPCKMGAPGEDVPNSNIKSQSQMKSSNEELSEEIRRALKPPEESSEESSEESFEIANSERNGSSLLEDEDEDLYGDVAAEKMQEDSSESSNKTTDYESDSESVQDSSLYSMDKIDKLVQRSPSPAPAPQQVSSKAPQPSSTQQAAPKPSTSKAAFKSLQKKRQKSKTPPKNPTLRITIFSDDDSDSGPERRVTRSTGKTYVKAPPLKAPPHLMPVDVPKTKTIRKANYTPEESQTLLDYICKKKLYLQIKGREMWENMEERKEPFVDRTWQSMKEHFLKQVYPEEKMKNFKMKDGDRKMFDKHRVKKIVKRNK